ncbi:uncharacterized protein LOC122043656 [Zingiber officinale]|uniref:uncharacterized protein LOC122043656 n=1 Tax=Zingiber officinale TaxID=94328 RepID=UPI001C4D1AB1|nr:uncharacterized protein LOC122043656 [Zingiber officinale]
MASTSQPTAGAPAFRTKWQTAVPTQPELGKFKSNPAYLHAANQLATERLKLRAAEIEAAKDNEVAERGLVSAGSALGGEEGTQIALEVLTASASLNEAGGDIASSTQAEVEGRSADEAPLATRKPRRQEQASQPTPSDEQRSERGDDAPVISEAVSKESTPTPLGSPRAASEVPPTSPPRTLRRLRRLGDRPSTIGEPSGKAAAPQDDPSGPRVIKTVLRFPSEEYLLAADRPMVPEQQITLTGPLAKAWEDARLRIALMTPNQLGDSNLQQVTGDELKKLKTSGESRQSTTALEKAKKLLEADRNRSSDLASEVARLEALVKQRDKEIKLATSRKLKAIDDMDLMKVETRGLEQRVKDLDDLLTTERESRSAEKAKSEGDLKDLQAALDASQATLKEYQDGELGRLAESCLSLGCCNSMANSPTAQAATALAVLQIKGSTDRCFKTLFTSILA